MLLAANWTNSTGKYILIYRCSWATLPSSNVCSQVANCLWTMSELLFHMHLSYERLIIKRFHFRYLLSIIGNNPSAIRSFSRLSINCFVDSNRRLRWCPAAGCEKAVKVGPSWWSFKYNDLPLQLNQRNEEIVDVIVDLWSSQVSDRDTISVECSCKCRFCFQCGKQSHAPLDCRWNIFCHIFEIDWLRKKYNIFLLQFAQEMAAKVRGR